MEYEPADFVWLPEQSQRLLAFACTRMVRSYKPVLTRILLNQLPQTEIPLARIQDEFVDFYLQREAAGLPIERRGSFFSQGGGVDPEAARLTARKILRFVFQRHDFLLVTKQGVSLTHSQAWSGFTDRAVLARARDCLKKVTIAFFERIELEGEAVYGQSQRDIAADAHEMVFLLPDPDDGDDLFILP